MKYIKLSDRTNIPQLGYGTYKLQGNDCVTCVSKAIRMGYRHIDTATRYGNHQEVGSAIRESGVPRNEIFLTTKLWRDDMGYEGTKKACKRSLDELQTEYVDLYLIHYPNKDVSILETIKALNELKKEGLIREYGVSNFTTHHIEDVLQIDDQEVVNNQVEIHPTLYQQALINSCRSNGIAVTAYSPLGQGVDLALSEVVEISRKHNINRSNVILSWLMSKGLIVIPKGTDEDQIQANLDSLDVNLDQEDYELLDKVNRQFRIINPPYAEFDY